MIDNTPAAINATKTDFRRVFDEEFAAINKIIASAKYVRNPVWRPLLPKICCHLLPGARITTNSICKINMKSRTKVVLNGPAQRFCFFCSPKVNKIEDRTMSKSILETFNGSYENQGVMKIVSNPTPQERS